MFMFLSSNFKEKMKLSQFRFKLPQEQIAMYPHSLVREFTNDDGSKESFRVTRRDEARLMVLHRTTGEIEMFKKDEKGNPIEGKYIEFRDILDYFDEGDTFVMNDTKVFPARLYGTKEKTDAKIEVFGATGRRGRGATPRGAAATPPCPRR